MEALKRAIRARLKPMQPISADIPPRLRPLPEILAVVFDVFGTLLISAAGEISAHVDGAHRAAALAGEAVAAAGIELPAEAEAGLAVALTDELARRRAAAQAAGVPHPDPDIRDAWRAVLKTVGAVSTTAQVERLTVEFELRANPTWLMPGALACLRSLHGHAALGIVSNAQFSTQFILDEQLGGSLSNLVPRDRCLWSYQHGRAKPGTELFELAAERFAAAGIGRSECLFVGNDMLNDVWAAAACGFRTALFAGDARSLRLRYDDERCRALQPDLIITALEQLPPLLR